jgi:large subunit ribosomal protein L54
VATGETPPTLTTPLPTSEDAPTANGGKVALSSCPAGTTLTGLNYFKGKTDPVAKPDGEYPDWLWRCLEVQKKTTEETEADAGDEFCKSWP